jgi:hypothetical protein
MSTDLVVFEYKFPAIRGHKPRAPALFSYHLEVLPEAMPVMPPYPGRSGGVAVERQTLMYGPDAKIISTVAPGLIIDLYT